jgi:hypothetical protein
MISEQYIGKEVVFAQIDLQFWKFRTGTEENHNNIGPTFHPPDLPIAKQDW